MTQIKNQIMKILLALVALTALAATLKAETVTYYFNDLSGSPVAAMDSSGNRIWRESYQPYGEKRLKPSASNNDIGYTGHQNDDFIGLTYMQARYYDATLGRFYGVDPIPYTEKNPVQSFNPYLYVNNNPYKYVDPDGLWATWVHYRMTYNAALEAGLSKEKSKQLAQAVVDVDQGTQSSDCGDTVVHGMNCAEGGSSRDAIHRALKRLDKPSLLLAERIHTLQDLKAEHHAGKVWESPFESKDVVTFVKRGIKALAHLIKDIFISEEKEKETTDETRKLIEECSQNCE